jgi:hypothetical protein
MKTLSHFVGTTILGGVLFLTRGQERCWTETPRARRRHNAGLRRVLDRPCRELRPRQSSGCSRSQHDPEGDTVEQHRLFCWRQDSSGTSSRSTAATSMRGSRTRPHKPTSKSRRRYASAGQLAPRADAPAPHRLRQLSPAASLTPAGRTLSVEKKKTEPECGFGAPGTKIETRPLLSASV